MARIEDLPLLRFALPSFIASAEPESFHYAIDIGADSGDVWYDHPGHQARIVAWWNDKWQQNWPCIHVPLRIFIYNNTHSRNSWAVNYLTQRAYEEGFDYFYRINDDTVLKPNGWFISRRHMDIFGCHFPFGVGNSWSDDLIQNVYMPPYPVEWGTNVTLMRILLHVPVTHRLVIGRYEVYATVDQYRRQLALWRDQLDGWMRKALHLPPLVNTAPSHL